MIFQSEINECGLACLAMVSCFHGRNINIRELRSSYSLSAVGASIKHLIQAADNIGLRSRPLKLELDDVERLTLPAILHWDMDHFVILKKLSKRKAVIHDPAVGIRRYRREELGRHFTGVAVELTPACSFQNHVSTPDLSLRQLFRTTGNAYTAITKGPIIQIFLLSLLIQFLALLSPLYLQLVIDQGINKGDRDLVMMIALLFLILVIARNLVSYCRGVIVMHFGNRLGFHLVSDTFRHMLHLPLNFFEKRELGDIVSRFSSLESIKQLVTHEMITIVVDGLFSLVTVVLLFLYSPLLALIALCFVATFSVIRVFTIPIERNRRQESLVAGAKQESRFIENIRSISVTKLNGIEAEREADWQNRYVDFINSGYRLGHYQLGVGLIQGLIFGFDHIATIYFGSLLVFDGELTLGQLMSFVFLKQHFTSSVNAMIPKLAELKLINLELERVADIVLHEPEKSRTGPALLSRTTRGRLEVDGVTFQYSDSDPVIIQDLSFAVDPGQLVAITGKSGCGKSTLLKILLALEKPKAGQVLLDGMAVADIGADRIRQRVAAVLHSDSLLAGDIAYNINLGIDPFDDKRLITACERAGIFETISDLPLGFSTQIGEMGSIFSAGQVQRLLVARALYRLPDVLVLDEALSHLGNKAARLLLSSIKKLGITVILVTHNPQLIAMSDEEITIESFRSGSNPVR